MKDSPGKIKQPPQIFLRELFLFTLILTFLQAGPAGTA